MLIWVDVETLGLNPRFHELLEVGIVLTDDDLNEIRRTNVIIRNSRAEHAGVYFDGSAQIDQAVRDMHRKNGLFDLSMNVGIPVTHAESFLLGFMHDFPQSPMVGPSVHFDRAFLTHYMPKLAERFHYRNIDVSTIRQLTRAWRPELVPPEERKTHRALSDIEDSVALLKFYRETLWEKK